MTVSKLIHVPHASTLIPDEFRSQFLLDDNELQKEAVTSADLYTDVLARQVWPNAEKVVAGVSRLVCDVERYPDDGCEAMSDVGRGMIYTSTSQARKLRRELSASEKEHIRRTIYDPHWSRLREMAKGCVLIDLHSYPKDVWPIEQNRSAHRPEIDIGTTHGVTPLGWQNALHEHFAEHGYDVAIDTPYEGVIDAGANSAVMIEIRRDVLGEPSSAGWMKIVGCLKKLPMPTN